MNNSIPNLKAEATAAAAPQLHQLRKATDQLEAIFMKNLLTEMEKGTSMFGTGPSSGIYEDLMNEQLSESLGSTGSLGISRMLYNQLSPRILSQVEAQIRLHPKNTQPSNKSS